MVIHIGRIDRHITYYWWCAYIKLELEVMNYLQRN
nr:MAG TPA: hypothetical protein [Bacteriophage sp.]